MTETDLPCWTASASVRRTDEGPAVPPRTETRRVHAPNAHEAEREAGRELALDGYMLLGPITVERNDQ